MGKPVRGDVVVLPFPQTDLIIGKRRPALVLATSPGDDLILCQITSQARTDSISIALTSGDFAKGQLSAVSFVRVNRLFTVDQKVIHYTVGQLTRIKIEEILAAARNLFVS